MYEQFARVYDQLMADVDYGRWASYYASLAESRGISVQKAADCACGTGNLTLALAARGIQMTGIDLSADMLRIATQKALSRGIRMPFVRQDMRRLLLHRAMDAIFCACDGVNYLVQPAEVQAFFAAAYRALRPGGGLFFDVSTEAKLAITLGNNCLGSDDKAVSYIWQNHFDPQSRQLQMDLTFFLLEPSGLYARFDETHFQRAHSPGELVRWLEAAGFADIAVEENQCFSTAESQDTRIHIAAIRPQP